MRWPLDASSHKCELVQFYSHSWGRKQNLLWQAGAGGGSRSVLLSPSLPSRAEMSPLGSSTTLRNSLHWQLQLLRERALCSHQSPPKASGSIRLFRNRANTENFSLSLKGSFPKAAQKATKTKACNKANLHGLEPRLLHSKDGVKLWRVYK